MVLLIAADRLDRMEARKLVERLTTRLQVAEVQHVWCGSWRRGLPSVKDLDLVVVNRDADWFSVLLDLPMKAGGPSRAHYNLGDGRQLDVWSCTREQTAPMCLFATGPGRLNIVMRTKAERAGLLLNQYGLWEGQARVDDNTERDIFDKVGMTYRTPAERERDFG